MLELALLEIRNNNDVHCYGYALRICVWLVCGPARHLSRGCCSVHTQGAKASAVISILELCETISIRVRQEERDVDRT